MPLAKLDTSRRRFLRERFISVTDDSTDPDVLGVVSSLILQVRPEKLADVSLFLESSANAEVHANDGRSKIVVVLESESDEELADFMTSAAEIAGVINVSMVFHHVHGSEHSSPSG